MKKPATRFGLAHLAALVVPQSSSAWTDSSRAIVARVVLILGVILSLVGAVIRWGAWPVGLVLVGFGVGLAIFDELHAPQASRAQVSELKSGPE